MADQRVQVTSLRRPPDGWDQEAEARVRLARETHPWSTRGWERRQPREQNTGAPDQLPTLTPGIDRLPTECPTCTSRFLNVEPPLGQHQRGLITCGRCSRQVCWLAAPIGSRVPDAFKFVIPAPETPREAPRPIRLAVTRLYGFERGAGCSSACTDRTGHDVITHEEYGWAMALEELRAKPSGRFASGPLIIDFDQASVSVGGVDVVLGETERGLLLFLASRPGQACRYFDIVAAVWDRQTACLWQESPRSWNSLRTPMSRLRQRLGAAGPLIETISQYGHRLRVEPPTETDVAS